MNKNRNTSQSGMKRLTNSFLFLLCIIVLTSCGSQKTKQNLVTNTYTNPVIPGDFPDPTVIRVGDMYYAAGTSNNFAPNYPMLQSSDLVNWESIGRVFNELPEWASNDFWAPELYYNNGTFYVYYTAKRKDNGIACIGVATTKNIHEGFTDHGILIEWGDEAIDAFVFKDDDGKLYITWKAYGLTHGRDIEILGSEMTPDGLSLVGEHFTLTDHELGWKGAGDEGQCIVKRDGYYYMFYSIGGCCDNRCDYRVMVSRSKNIKADWEQLPEPILQGGETWRCSGHGTLVTTPDNRDFYLYHAYNAVDFEYIGRQGLLDEIVWNKETGWPYFKNGDTPSVTAEMPFKNSKQIRETLFADDFTTNKNDKLWEWDIDYKKPSFETVNGELHISPSFNKVNFLGTRPKTGNYTMTTEIVLTTEFNGIGIYSNQENMLGLMASTSELFLCKAERGEKKVHREKIDIKNNLFLKYEAVDGRYIQFFWSNDEKNWYPINFGDNIIDGAFLPQWGFSPRAGFIVGGSPNNKARYKSLKIEYEFK